MSDIWYHGSPIKFDKFELGHRPNSRLGNDGSLYFTKKLKIAEAFSHEGYIYTVRIKDHKSNKEFILPELSYDCDVKDTGAQCVSIYRHNLIEIIKIEKYTKTE